MGGGQRVYLTFPPTVFFSFSSPYSSISCLSISMAPSLFFFFFLFKRFAISASRRTFFNTTIHQLP